MDFVEADLRRHFWTSGFLTCVPNRNRRSPLTFVYRRHEQEKKKTIRAEGSEVEHVTFTPLVMSATGGMGRAATIFHKRLDLKRNTE